MDSKAAFRRKSGEEFHPKKAENFTDSKGNRFKEAGQQHEPKGVGDYSSNNSALQNRKDYTLAVLFIVSLLVCLFILAYA